ncbi:MAG: histidine phosphatase family protein [Pseudomonadota bacterium]
MRALIALVVLLFTVSAEADEAILKRLAEPNTHAIMRHALAPGRGEPEDFDLSDCATQRNLSVDGVRQAGRAGDMVRAAGVDINQIWSSLYCRNMDTAREMALGEITRKSSLNFFGQDKSSNRRRTEAIAQELASMPSQETILVVGHSRNIEALTGTRPLSGEIQVVRFAPDGTVTLLGSVEVPVF